MPLLDAIAEAAEYRLVLVLPDSRQVLVIDTLEGLRLPAVRIPHKEWPAQRLQKAIREAWQEDAIILDILPPSDNFPACAVAEILSPKPGLTLKPVSLDQIQGSALSEEQRAQIESTLLGNARSDTPFARIGWIDEAIAWLESSTRERISSKQDIQQYKAGGGFSLLRFRVEDGSGYWLKATDRPNLHERSVTEYLYDLSPSYLPTLVSSKPEWNAWIMAEEGRALPAAPMTPFQIFTELEQAVMSAAEMQDDVEGRSLDLLDAGAFDQGLEVFEEHTAELFAYLEEAMSRNTERKSPRLGRRRLAQLRNTFEEVCYRMDGLGLGETIVHGDVQWSNILTGWGTSQFIDWSEAYLGHPFVMFEHLLRLNTVENPEIHDLIHRVLVSKYRDHWTMNCASEWVDQGLVYMPLLAIGSSLYGRGDWLRSAERYDPRRLSCARTLAWEMDQAVRKPELRAALSH